MKTYKKIISEIKFAKNLPKAPGQRGSIKRLKVMAPDLDNFDRSRNHFLVDLIGKKAGLEFKGSDEVMANVQIFIKNARIKKSYIEFSYDDGYLDDTEEKKVAKAVSLTKTNIKKWIAEVDANKIGKKEMAMMNKVAKVFWDKFDEMSLKEIAAYLKPAQKATGIHVMKIAQIGEDGPDMRGYENDPELGELYSNIAKIAKALGIKV